MKKKKTKKGKNALPLSTSAEKSAQSRRLPVKTVGDERDADTRRFPCLFVSCDLRALGARTDQFRTVRCFFFLGSPLW